MPGTPIKIARRRAALAKRGLVFGSAVAFGVTVGLARASHPATAASSSSTTSSVSSSTQSSSSTSTFGSATVSPSTTSQTPSVSTGVS